MPNITKLSVLERLCNLSSNVCDKVYDFTVPADCFCTNKMDKHYLYDEQVIKFIEDAVNNKIQTIVDHEKAIKKLTGED